MHSVSEASLLGLLGKGSEAGERGMCSSILCSSILNEEPNCVGNGEETHWEPSACARANERLLSIAPARS